MENKEEDWEDQPDLDPKFIELLTKIDEFFMRDENGDAEKVFDEFASKHAHHFEEGFDDINQVG